MLRPMQMEDAPALHAFFSDAQAMTYWSAPHTSLAETEEWVRSTVTSPRHITREFSIVKDAQVIGKAGLWQSPELGYFLTRDHWGQGLMQEALRTLVPHLFQVMDLPVMKADVTPGNVGSEKVLAALGFTHVRRAERDYWDGLKWCDTDFYELPNPAL